MKKYIKIIYSLKIVLFSTILSAQINDTEMVTISAGEFIMGCNYNSANPVNCAEESSPAHTVKVSAFQMDKYLVTFRRYNQCKAAGACTNLYAGAACNSGEPWNSNHPVNCVDYAQAQAFCTWDGGKRLPTEAEWEKAARGTDARKFPWGNEDPDCSKIVMNKKENGATMGPGCGSGTTMPVGSKPAGASPYGAMDLEGQVFEWTQDWFDPTYYQTNTNNIDPKGPIDGGVLNHKVLKGSSWLIRSSLGVLSSNRSGYSPLGQGYVVGFRCVKSL